MLNIMLVDDEPIIKHTLKNIINWEQHGYSVIASAYNGWDALRQLGNNNELEIDIVITDIRMPEMDGIQLIKAISLLEFNIKTIALSSYEEFSLLRSAYNNGAINYMLKAELSEEYIIETLNKVSNEILEERTQSLYLENMIADSVFKEKFIKDIIWNNKNMDGKAALAKKLGIRFKIGMVAFLYLGIDEYVTNNEYNNTTTPKAVKKFEYLRLVEEILEKYNIGDCFFVTGAEFAIAFSFGKYTSVNTAKQKMCQIYLMPTEQPKIPHHNRKKQDNMV